MTRSAMVSVGSPCGSAPLKIRRTLYCWPVISNGAHTVSKSVLIRSAVESNVLYGTDRGVREFFLTKEGFLRSLIANSLWVNS